MAPVPGGFSSFEKLSGLGMVLLFGLMGWLEIPLNAANMIVLPLILGIGIDAGVHVVHDYCAQRGRYRISASTASAVVVNSVTNMAGFGSLMIASHRGLQSLGRVLTLGLTCCLFTSLVMLPALLGLVSRGRRGGLAMGNLFGRSLETLFSLMIALALLSSLSAFIILGPRVYYAMAKDGYFFRFVSEISPKSRLPSKAIVLQGIIAAVIVLSGTLDQILTYMGFSLGIFPLLAVFGIFRLRRSTKSPHMLPGYPAVPLFYLFFGIAMLLHSFFERPIESSISILTVAVGVPAYYLFKRSHTGRS